MKLKMRLLILTLSSFLLSSLLLLLYLISFNQVVVTTIVRFVESILIYLPLAAIGIWRWGVWLFKKSCAQFYTPVHAEIPPYHSTLSIVTPVYDENPNVFRMALNSWKENSPNELIAVIDQSDTSCIEIFREFSHNRSWARSIITAEPGKRRALSKGILEAKGKIVALVDSDTIWAPNIRQKLLAPFRDPKIAGVTTKVHPIEIRSVWQKMTDIFWDIRNTLDMPSQSAEGETLSCLSGRTSLYRRDIILSKLDEFQNEILFGRRKESGEDKCLTRLIQKDGWRTYYQSNAEVYSEAALDFKTFWKQRLRWSRNTHNSDLTSLGDGWVWRHAFLTFFMLDRFISIFTIFIGPIFLGIALYLNHWIVALSIVLWWILGRGIRILPHLRRRPKDIQVLPVYVAVNFLSGLIKLYALVTIREQKVIRGEVKEIANSRRRSSFIAIKDAVLTGGIISFLVIMFATALRHLVSLTSSR